MTHDKIRGTEAEDHTFIVKSGSLTLDAWSKLLETLKSLYFFVNFSSFHCCM